MILVRLSRSIRRWSLVAVVVLLAGLSTGCARVVPTQSFIDPDVGTTRYDAFLAYAAFRDLSVAGRFEQAMCRALAEARHACTRMLAVATPTRPQDGSSRQRAAATSGAQATLFIELADPETTSRQVLANGRPAFRISVVDIATQRIVARLAIDPAPGTDTLPAQAKAVAHATTTALRSSDLLLSR